jgi:hypothetical protein
VLQQASCLMQNSDQLVLDDGHGQSMVSTLTEGAGSDLLGAISTTKVAGGGAYSPYVGVVVDLARLMENLHTAKYQYISALALPQGDELHLRLNYPPSFHKPQSVIVIGLPVVQSPVPPALHPVPADAVNCAQNPNLVLGADGAPLVFSSELAHHLTLHMESKDGKSMEIPVVANALQGGFVPTAPVPNLDWQKCLGSGDSIASTDQPTNCSAPSPRPNGRLPRTTKPFPSLDTRALCACAPATVYAWRR